MFVIAKCYFFHAYIMTPYCRLIPFKHTIRNNNNRSMGLYSYSKIFSSGACFRKASSLFSFFFPMQLSLFLFCQDTLAKWPSFKKVPSSPHGVIGRSDLLEISFILTEACVSSAKVSEVSCLLLLLYQTMRNLVCWITINLESRLVSAGFCCKNSHKSFLFFLSLNIYP